MSALTKSNPRTVLDSFYGYRRLDPIPTGLDEFYENMYYELAERGERTINEDGPWLQQTVYSDICDAAELAPNDKLLDVGCGRGDFLAGVASGSGLDVADGAVRKARRRGLDAVCCPFLGFHDVGWGTITMLHYLAHTPNPVEELRHAHKLLEPGGLLVIRTGNDFNPIQHSAAKQYGEFWVSSPDIINYFNFASLVKLLEGTGFQPIDAWADFPMASFLLDGYDYVNDKEVGRLCHERRVQFELAMPSDLRRMMGRTYARIGIGRCAHIVGVKL